MARGTAVNTKEAGTSYFRGLLNNSTTTSFPTTINTVTEPVTVDASHLLIGVGQWSDMRLGFFGTGNDGDTFVAKIVGWSSVRNGLGNSTPAIWKPTTLMTVTCTLSTSVGVADATQTDLERDADTLVIGSPAISNSLYSVYSPADNTPAILMFNVLDFEKIGIYFDRTGATGANVLTAWIQ